MRISFFLSRSTKIMNTVHQFFHILLTAQIFRGTVLCDFPSDTRLKYNFFPQFKSIFLRYSLNKSGNQMPGIPAILYAHLYLYQRHKPAVHSRQSTNSPYAGLQHPPVYSMSYLRSLWPDSLIPALNASSSFGLTARRK